MPHSLDKSYFENNVFKTLKDLNEFYDHLAHGMFLWFQPGLENTLNIDTYTFSSIQGTIESIETVLSKGRINDAFALVRKYFDSVIINIYTSLYLKENVSIENFVVSKINDWKHGRAKLPKTPDMTKYIINSKLVSHITKHINADLTYKVIRDRCNDHMHYNYFKSFTYNDNRIHLPNRNAYLNALSSDVKNIFVLHFAYEFTINPQYMTSSDFTDHMEAGLTPPDNSGYWVAPYIQEVFDNHVKPINPELGKTIIENTCMYLK